jgi:Zn-finger nucleic acid-binding protein
LAEIDEGKVKIDVCVNKDCGAIHLDPGELKEIIKDQSALSAAKNAFLSVFK